jgi:hypothetical protein
MPDFGIRARNVPARQIERHMMFAGMTRSLEACSAVAREGSDALYRSHGIRHIGMLATPKRR